ncbi:MAG: FliM/FliN family flagellar motor switch protein [Planctomycetes bacterium]|nr:FliM/FliN family flagellar motor switch protein [Planctomycetota bacterium]
MYPVAAPQPTAPAAGTVGANVAAAPAAIDYSDLNQVPPYTKNLLRIRLPVQVTLASKRQPISRILDLGPGVIIQFSKSCEEMLALEVAGQPIAEGEPVKVGDKFGLRITSVTVPKEHFKAIGKKRTE